MTHVTTISMPDSFTPIEIATPAVVACEAVVVVVSDNTEVGSVLDNICEFLGFGVEIVPTDAPVGPMLRRHRPMAVIAELEGRGQDGCHVMMQVADHDPGLPILMLTGNEPGLVGAVDAVEELWNLTGVTKSRALPDIGHLVEFLFHAGRRGDCLHMMPV
jgi:CheY-like chemotaxis protein